MEESKDSRTYEESIAHLAEVDCPTRVVINFRIDFCEIVS
jgi:hypothetical protein